MTNPIQTLEELTLAVDEAKLVARNRKKTITGAFAKYKRREVQIRYRQLYNKLKKLKNSLKHENSSK